MIEDDNADLTGLCLSYLLKSALSADREMQNYSPECLLELLLHLLCVLLDEELGGDGAEGDEVELAVGRVVPQVVDRLVQLRLLQIKGSGHSK